MDGIPRPPPERTASTSARACDNILLHAGRLELAHRLNQWRYFLSNNNWPALLAIINNGIDAELANTSILGGRTALMQATGAQQPALVAALAAVPGIRLDAVDLDGNTALLLAAYVGNTQIVAMLHDADINAVDFHGDSALLITANKNHTEAANILIGTPGIDLNRANRHGLSPLHCAALDNHHEIVRRLLNTTGIDVNAIDENGHSALMLAAANGHSRTVELLCKDMRTNLALRDPARQDALMLAYDHPLVIDLLQYHTELRHASEGESPDARGCIGNTLSHALTTVCGLLPQRTRRADTIALIDRQTDQQATVSDLV